MPLFRGPDGWRIHFETTGEGAPLFLLHGVIQSGGEWRRAGWTEVLGGRRRLILVDLLGHGRSDTPHEHAPYRVESRAARILALADELELDQLAIMGFSLGGRIGYEIAVTRPQRLERIAILGQHARAPVTQREVLERQIEGFRAGRLVAMERGLGIRGNQAGKPVNDPEALAVSLEALLEWGGAEDRLHRANVPALIAAGEQDPFFEAARSSAAAMPCARFLSCGALGHAQSFYQPAPVASLVHEFFASPFER